MAEAGSKKAHTCNLSSCRTKMFLLSLKPFVVMHEMALLCCGDILSDLNQYKIPIALTLSQVFSETTRCIATYDIPADSV